ncbi:hypothetical protein C0Q44_00325 [Paenibacillus sp. PCH8]|nr:hypothetical protein C0Q44_00325 [Paenibacillus sp. PCH8]
MASSYFMDIAASISFYETPSAVLPTDIQRMFMERLGPEDADFIRVQAVIRIYKGDIRSPG